MAHKMPDPVHHLESLADVRPISRESLSDKIIEQITDLIGRGVLKPGDRLPSERDLCKRFGVGRTSLREALRSLSVMGILEGRVGEGTFVSRDQDRQVDRMMSWGTLLGPKSARDLLETRLMLETRNAELAAERATEADLKEIDSCLEHTPGTIEAMEHSMDGFLEFDLRFHLLIARATQNTVLHSLLATTRSYLHVWIRKALEGTSSGARARARLSLDQHLAIAESIRSRDPEAARQAMHDHILSSGRDLRAGLLA